MLEWKDRIVGHGKKAASQFMANPKNWRVHPQAQREALRGALNEIGWIAPVVENTRTGALVDGHERVWQALRNGDAEVPYVQVDLSEEEEAYALATLDPIGAMAEADRERLDELLAEVQSGEAGVQAMLAEVAEKAGVVPPMAAAEQGVPVEHKSLSERFLVPPFSVLDARQGYWQERKRAWLSLGIQSELGRGENAVPWGPLGRAASLGDDGHSIGGDGIGRADDTSRKNLAAGRRGLARCYGQDLMRGEHALGEASKAFKSQSRLAALQKTGDSHMANDAVNSIYGRPVDAGNAQSQTGTSIFDPVLCELAYRWFCPPDGLVLDPFAGGSVRGIVAAKLGRRYVGIELRPEQIAANEQQARKIAPDTAPRWLEGDALDVATLAPGEYDFVFTCPPYADLEVYSDDPRDLSTMDYPAFIDAYRRIIAASIAMLKPDRFAVVCVGDVRDGKGLYRNFVSNTIAAFWDAGAALYNEAILVTAVGSLPIRVGRQFEAGRKLGKAHQNVLVFVKGDPRKATAACGPVAVDWPDDEEVTP